MASRPRQLSRAPTSNEHYVTSAPSNASSSATSSTTQTKKRTRSISPFSHIAANDYAWPPADQGYAPSWYSGHTTSSVGRAHSGSNLYDGNVKIEGEQNLVLRTKRKMQTGCIPCLMRGVPCDPRNEGCRLVLSDEWRVNETDQRGLSSDDSPSHQSTSLSLFRPDTKWKRTWRERHSLNFFANYSAPQMAGFFDSAFWHRMVIQTSFVEPAISYAITAIGSLHEATLQRAFIDERRRAQTTEFALDQCNKAITCLTTSVPGDTRVRSLTTALTTCVLFTCFEAMQGRCDSAVSHALQGRSLLEAADRVSLHSLTSQEISDIEQMRPLVERLEVQATALLDKDKKPAMESVAVMSLLPPITSIHSLDHAHNALHVAMNSVMRFMQGFRPEAPREESARFMAEKSARYFPWFQQWEISFTTFLSSQTSPLSSRDVKKAMVLKANQLVATMLASVDQSVGPSAYDAYETEFRAIVDLAREVLASYSCPPLPSLTGGQSAAPYLSFSLWVTDPLWMAISRCRNASIRQIAFTLLSQNPRQEGIWHAGPVHGAARPARKSETPVSSQDESQAESAGLEDDDEDEDEPRPGDGYNNASSSSSSRPGTAGQWSAMLARIEQRSKGKSPSDENYSAVMRG